jgi:ribosomal protein S18 acetylase RimI-like enzyme
MDQLETLRRLEGSYATSIRSKEDLIRSGPFLISLHPTMKLVWLNNAIIDDESHLLDSAAILNMAEEFRKRERTPRMELFQELRPELVTMLQGEGFEVECVLPVMVCTKEMFVPHRTPGIQLMTMTPDMDPTPFIRIIDIAFEHDEPITPERIDGMRQSIRKGTQWSAMAMIDSAPAAVASLVIADGVAELAGVGTHPDYRRRGAASTVSTHLLEQFFQQADLAWLSAGDDTSRAVYERLGFRVAGNQVNISKPSA